MNYTLLAAAIISIAVAYMLTPLVRVIAERYGIVAHPGGRRVHSRPTPLMGGVAIYGGFIIAVLIAVVMKPKLLDTQAIGVLVAGTFVAIVGVLDDKFELPGWLQAGSILLGATILVLFGVEIRHISDPLNSQSLILFARPISVFVTLLWVLMVTKAVDCMDGLDGLAAGISTIAAGTLMLMAYKAGPKFGMSAIMAAALMGGAIGFLRYNYPPAKIFMGTIGSQFLGFMLAGISIAGAFKIATLVAVAAPVLVLGVPLFDTTFVVLKRALSGKRVHEADKSHLHHRLVDRGLSHRQVIWFIYALTFVFCGIAYWLFRYIR